MQLHIPWEEAGLPLMLTVVRSRLRQVSWRLLAPYGVTPQQYQAIRALADAPGISHGELAGTMGLDKPTATRLVQALQRKGLVDVQPHPKHGRKTCLKLSPKGKQLISRLGSFRKTIREALERDFTEAEQKALRSLLRRLVDNLDRAEEESIRNSQESPSPRD